MKKLKISKKIVLKESSTTIEAIKKITIGDYRFQLVIKGEKRKLIDNEIQIFSKKIISEKLK